MSYKIIIAEDHQLIVAGYRIVLDNMPEVEVVGTAKDGRQALHLIERLNPELLLLDLMLPKLDGLKILEHIQKHKLETKVLVISMIKDYAICRDAMRYGVSGFVLKHIGQQEFEMAIRIILEGKKYFSPEIFEHHFRSELEDHVRSGAIVSLTNREKEVLELIANGHTNKEIAVKLFLSPKTVETHRVNLMKKIEVRNVAGLVRYAIVYGYCSETRL